MKLTTQSQYAVRAIFDMAYHSDGLDVQTEAISRRQGISPRYLQQIFQKLTKAKVLGSKRGPSGGYFLMKEPEDITVGEIVRITEGGLSLVSCERNGKLKKPCGRWNECVTRLIWKEAANKLKEYLDSVTIKDLCEWANEMRMGKELLSQCMYPFSAALRPVMKRKFMQ